MYGSINGRIGRLETKTVGDNQTFLLEIAVVEDHYEKGQKKGTWYKCEYWGKRAESAANYVFKGQNVSIVGQSWAEEYTDQHQQKKQVMKCKVDHLVMHSFQGDNARKEPQDPPAGSQYAHQQPNPDNMNQNAFNPPPPPPTHPQPFEDDIPF